MIRVISLLSLIAAVVSQQPVSIALYSGIVCAQAGSTSNVSVTLLRSKFSNQKVTQTNSE